MQDMTWSASNDEKSLTEKLRMLEVQLKETQHEKSELEDQLEKYKAAASGANDGLWDWNSLKNETFVSEPWKAILGFAPHDKLPENAWENFLHPDDKERAIKYFNDFVKGAVEDYNQEFRLRHKNGTYRWISSKAKARRNEYGEAIRISGTHTDITDRKLAAESVKKSEAKYRNLFENSLVAMFRMQVKTGAIISANSKLLSMLEVESLDGKNFYEFFSSDLDKKMFEENLLDNEGVDNLELQLCTAKNNVLWVSFSGVYYGEDHEIDCVLKDITQTKENLLELQKVNFELDSFVYHASHDLRSPLRSVLGLIDLYRMEETQSIREECIDKIESSVKRLDMLVMDLLSISRNDRVNEPHKEIMLMNEINSSITSYYNASNTKGLEIHSKVRQPIKFVTDLTRVRIILNNLISNAIKYRSFNKEKSLIQIEAVVDDKKAVLKVQDNGEGIEESKLPHIFDMFYRATEKSEGSGLGLYIVKKVADKLNAKIEVDSVELEGTTFTITIPNLKNLT